ncbi:MAG: YcjX family protein [Cohaesibacteraceae bacterium]|nr:YcjX family protein [Cohaesibacteraceae bacterium]MBL4874945.1 YcjX family protein [Cohaesibacteraceae bacterium]
MNWKDETRNSLLTAQERLGELLEPTIRIGVTGLARSGKTVFISAVLHNLIHDGRLPRMAAVASGQIQKAYLTPQPDPALPRFRYEEHIKNIIENRTWPKSTRRISQVRLTIEYEPSGYIARKMGRNRIHLDFVDYPGEWLLDLSLLETSYEQWSIKTLASSKAPLRRQFASDWHARIHHLNINLPEDPALIENISKAFTSYLQKVRDNEGNIALLTPGRFLMPGDLDGSPALTFAPIEKNPETEIARNSIWAAMESRFEAYKKLIVKPFFENHFARLDRQIVLVDVLNAVNGGPTHLRELEDTLTQTLRAFRPGKNHWLTHLLSRRIDRVLFAATKADHLHHKDHEYLEKLLGSLIDRARKRTEIQNINTDVVALSAIRATREATLHYDGTELPGLMGTPEDNQIIDDQLFDGKTEFALYPGDLSSIVDSLQHRDESLAEDENINSSRVDSKPEADINKSLHQFVRFVPPPQEQNAFGDSLSLPHIRLDRTLEFLVGDIFN